MQENTVSNISGRSARIALGTVLIILGGLFLTGQFLRSMFHFDIGHYS
jgi:hypothetical protein